MDKGPKVWTNGESRLKRGPASRALAKKTSSRKVGFLLFLFLSVKAVKASLLSFSIPVGL